MFDVLRAMDCRAVAAAFGVEPGRDGIACPCCHEERRGDADRRPPVGFRPDGGGWSCHRCGAHGDAVALAAAIVTGEVRPADWGALRARVADLGLVADERAIRPAARAPARPDPAELRDLWQSGRPPSDLPADHPAVAYLRGRGFDLSAASEMCRILPAERERWPEWWPAHWAATWRIVVLGLNAHGSAESIHARAIDPHATPKTRWPVGREASGLLFASAEGLALLTGWPSDRPAPEIVVGEGLTGLLGAGTRQRRPVLCATSGGWSALRDVRWPTGSVVIVATDNDAAGDAYARKIREALPKAVRTRRLVWQDDHDLGDCPGDVLERLIASARSWPTDPPQARVDHAIASWGGMTREERVAMLAELVEAGTALRDVAAERLDRLLTLASGAPGCAAAVKRLRALVGPKGPAVDLGGGDWSAGLGLTVTGTPSGWSISPSGIFRTGADGGQVRAVRAPIVITSRAVDVDGGATVVEVAWPGPDGAWTRRWVERGVLADTRRIVALAADDAPVDSVCARDVVAWLGDWEAMHRAALPCVRSAARTGWVREGTSWGYLLGTTPIGLTADVRIAPGSLLAGVAQALRPRGTSAGWCAVWPIMQRHPVAALAVYGSIAAALIEHLPEPGWWLSFAAPTSAGKTSALMVAASVWGHPTDGVFSTWDTSLVGLERRLAALRGLPCLLDDTSRARKPSDVGAAMYLLPSGMGRTRGALEGARDVDRWHAIGLSTSEAPMANYAEAGGAAARVLDLWGSPWEGDAGADVEAVRDIVAEHHGHLGPRVVEHIIAHREAIVARFDAELARFTGAATSGVQRRAASYVAMLEVAILVAEALGLPRVPGAIDRAWGETSRTAKAADHAAAAMTRLCTWLVAHAAEMYGHHDARRAGEWVGVWGPPPSVRPDLLPEILGVEPARAAALIREWGARGWLQVEGDRTTVKVAMGDERVRLVRLTRETWTRAVEG